MDKTSPTSNCHDKYNGEKYVASKKTITAEIYSIPNNGIIHTTDDIIFKNLIQTKHHKHFKWGCHCWWQIIFVWNSQKKPQCHCTKHFKIYLNKFHWDMIHFNVNNISQLTWCTRNSLHMERSIFFFKLME